MRRVIFLALVSLIVLTAIPYGTFEPWWKAAFICAVFGICIVAIIEWAITGSSYVGPREILLPLLTLAAFAYLQAISFDISADPYQTRFFALQCLALTGFLALLYRYANTDGRVRLLVHAVIAIAVASAIFGILRQTTQQQPGFVLPMLKQNQGYAQFINKNHFAYLMEMAFGLVLGLILGRGIRRDRLMIYAALLLPIWIALVLSNSRGGILAMLTQVVLCASLLLRRHKSILIGVLVVGVVIGTLWVGGDRLASNIESATTDFAGDANRDRAARSGASRNDIWRATLKMFAAHPIAGVGLGGYWIGITAYHDASGSLTPQEAHNEYLELLSSGGLIGLAIGVWFAVKVVRRVRTNLYEGGYLRAVRYGALVGLTGIVVHSLVDFGLHLMGNALVFLVLIMLATAPATSAPNKGSVVI